MFNVRGDQSNENGQTYQLKNMRVKSQRDLTGIVTILRGICTMLEQSPVSGRNVTGAKVDRTITHKWHCTSSYDLVTRHREIALEMHIYIYNMRTFNNEKTV